MRILFIALGIVLALTIIPFFITVGSVWSYLHFTNSGLLVGGGDLVKVATEQNIEKSVFQCPYITSSGYIEKIVDHEVNEDSGQRRCPWIIDVSA